MSSVRHKAVEIAKNLPNRFDLLSQMIARKPDSYTTEWATTHNEAFKLYTNTSTINLLNCVKDIITEFDYPFPSYIDIHNIQKEVACLYSPNISKKILWKIRRKPKLGHLLVIKVLCFQSKIEDLREAYDHIIAKIFRNNRDKIFNDLFNSQILQSKKIILKDIECAYSKKMWAACITTTLPLLDHIVRHYCKSNSLRISITTLRKAFFEKAILTTNDISPGFSTWIENKATNSKSIFGIQSTEKDLRLIGIYLSSFFECSQKYYEDHESIEEIPISSFNRHAITHGASECWSEANTIRILTFLHLTIQLENTLKILLQESYVPSI